ncbi:MAG: leucyl/phenylalanyl-tRNA--protein transferase [Planctomycetota bacterium]|nr:leucyl/phenylalanyl-tRNA--protein transferase [Planctomycetota bacterium]
MTRADESPRSGPPSPFAGVPMHPGEDLVAAGGVLGPALVLEAYRHGIFPWYDADDPVLWWSPDPRAILPLEAVHVPRRLERTIASAGFRLSRNEAFGAVVAACDERRPDGTWIHAAMQACYGALHGEGHAHSLEVWQGEALVGGIYGVAFGAGFAAESMFHRVRDASKVALVSLVRHLRAQGFALLDVQFMTEHLAQFGCVEIPREDYLQRVAAVRDRDVRF